LRKISSRSENGIMANPFYWGASGQKLSPSQVKSHREVATALAARNSAPKNLGEGLSRIGDALLYRDYMDKAQAGEEAGRKSGVAQALQAQQAGTPEAHMGVIANEWSTPAETALQRPDATRLGTAGPSHRVGASGLRAG
jgi:hypothetical protein